MDKIFYTNEELNEKSAIPSGSDLPANYYELLEYDLSELRSNYGLTIYDIEWTSEGITTDLDTAKTEKETALIEAEVLRCNKLCLQYQTGEAVPRLDTNFCSFVIGPYGLTRKSDSSVIVACPKCESNYQWLQTLWVTVWEDIKAKIRSSEDYSLDFAQLMIDAGSTANPRYGYDECMAELEAL